MRAGTAPRYLSFLLVFPLLVLAGCGEQPEPVEDELVQDEAAMMVAPEEEDPLAGEYMLAEGRRAVVEDGSYTVYDGEDVMVEGNYTYEGDQVIFVDAEGPMACPSDMRGVYTLALEADEPQLTVVEDPCEGRRRDITGEQGEGEEHEEH